MMKLLESDPLDACHIESVELSDAEEWALRMRDRGIAYRTISNDKRSLKSAFYPLCKVIASIRNTVT